MLELHGRAMRHSVVIVAMIHDDQWDLPTPCAEWTVLDLLTHYPRRYLDKTKQSSIRDARVDQTIWIFGKGMGVGGRVRSRYS